MNRITQEARKRQAVVLLAQKKGKAFASEKYGVSLSSVKRWSRRYDGTWQSLAERSHRPHSHPKQHTPEEEALIREIFPQCFYRHGGEEVYCRARERGYARSFSGMVYAAKRMGLLWQAGNKRPVRRQNRRYPELSARVRSADRHERSALQLPARGVETRRQAPAPVCTRYRFVSIFEEQTPENSARFLKMLREAFPFRIQTIQTDNGTEFTCKSGMPV